MERRLCDHAIDVPIRPLNEEKAAEAAGLLLAELSVYTVIVLNCFLKYVQLSRLLVVNYPCDCCLPLKKGV